MKTLTTLTAVAALVAGISIAQAQGTMGQTGSSSGSMSSLGVCSIRIGGPLNCKYASLAACEKDAKPQNLNCSSNPKKSTTGSKQ